MEQSFQNVYIAFFCFFALLYFLVFLGKIVCLKDNKMHSLQGKHKTKWQTEKQEHKDLEVSDF